jgi:two-component system, LytTR family, sensor kinase
MGWVGYVVGWVVAALFWAAAASWGSHRPPRETLLYGFLAMGTAGLMGVGVWALSGRLEWNWRSRRFLAFHALSLAGFALLYAASWIWPDVVAGKGATALGALRSSPVLIWNLLMGSWLYLMVAGFSYAIRAQRRARSVEAAAAEARLMAQQAQLAALRARLNPHFLYNALHSVGALVGRDPRRADQALERLGDLLRYVLDAGEEVPFRREWAFIQDYLAFEQLRLGERLRVEAEVDPAAATVLAPPLILQPLVENAVRHGLADRPEGGRIALGAHILDGQLVLTVDDDGAGAPAGEGTGIGVSSVRERLRVIYGDAASVEAGPRAHGFGVTLRLPVRHGGEELAA